ncbi:MAG TPA: tagatose-6-phosphate ketose isomerase [Candidatus Dormibacteraeota bacterium]|jgi:tagatose-6-phosphate ketose/aldose isomerase|nr:tagatose-6-phosphate ketose isomerase [Candidatus Dormibacteraeota bacterium]
MNPLSNLLTLPEEQKQARGVLHTPKEIAQQPETWRATYQRFRERHAEIHGFLQAAGINWDPTRRPTVFLIGAGTSDYVGRSLTLLLRRLWHCEVLAVPSTDLLTHPDEWLVPGRPYLWISFSRSGESPEGIAVIERALKNHPGIQHLIVTCNTQARMLRLTAGRKQVLGIALPEEVHDRGLAMTSSFSNMVIFGQCLANVETPGAYENILRQLTEAGTSFRDQAATCAAKLASEDFTKVCFIGSGPLRAVATESALKVLELTAGHVQTMSESALGLRHGPMAALDQQTLLVAFLSGDQRILRYEIDLLEEIGKKHLVRTRAVVGAAPDARLDDLTDYAQAHTSVTIADDYRPPLDAMFGQLLGLFFSLRHGLKPDCPSPSGAISRVVQNVAIHA